MDNLSILRAFKWRIKVSTHCSHRLNIICTGTRDGISLVKCQSFCCSSMAFAIRELKHFSATASTTKLFTQLNTDSRLGNWYSSYIPLLCAGVGYPDSRLPLFVLRKRMNSELLNESLQKVKVAVFDEVALTVRIRCRDIEIPIANNINSMRKSRLQDHSRVGVTAIVAENRRNPKLHIGRVISTAPTGQRRAISKARVWANLIVSLGNAVAKGFKLYAEFKGKGIPSSSYSFFRENFRHGTTWSRLQTFSKIEPPISIVKA